MNARLRDYRLLWNAALSHANPFGSAVIRWGVPLVTFVFAMAMGWTDGVRQALVLVWCVACVFILLTWTWRFLPGAVKLNSPANAALVPRMRARLIELACIVWFAAIVGIAAAPYADSGHLGTFLFWIVLGTVGTGLGVAGHNAGQALVSLAVMSAVFQSRVPEALHEFASRPAVLALALVLYAGIIAVAARAIFPSAGERHWRMVERCKRLEDANTKAGTEAAGARAFGWYPASLRRDSARRDSRRLVLHAFGPGHHLLGSVVALGLLSAILVAIAFLALWRNGTEVLAGVGWIFACTLLFVPLFQGTRLSQMAAINPVEQGLVRLAPAMPGTASTFNHLLGRGLLLQALKCWSVSAAAAMLLGALSGAGLPQLLMLGSVFCLILPALAEPLRNHAVRSRFGAATVIVLLLVSVILCLALGAASWWFTRLPVLPVAAGASIALAAIAITRGLRVMEASPFAFPAGRMD